MSELIKVNEIYWQYLTKPKSLYRKAKVIAANIEYGAVVFYYVGDPDLIFAGSVDVFLSNFGKTKKEAFEKEKYKGLLSN